MIDHYNQQSVENTDAISDISNLGSTSIPYRLKTEANRDTKFKLQKY